LRSIRNGKRKLWRASFARSAKDQIPAIELIRRDEQTLGASKMIAASHHEQDQLLARVTVLEHVVALMVRESMIRSGQSAGDILAFGEKVKTDLTNRTPSGATTKQLNEAANQLFSSIASDIGSQRDR
jgi:hypothetical protein